MKKETEKIEIPFGAKDSELYKFEYTIPEGYEAEIKDGKVIVKKKESEDERIMKEIVDFIYWAIDRGSITNEQRERSDSWLAYLEKKKEQKPVPKFSVGDYVKDTNYNGEPLYQIVDIDKECYICEYRGDKNMGDKAVMHFAFDNPYLRLEQKQVEWSEEDKKRLESIIHRTEVICGGNPYGKIKEDIDWLKSLRPQIKQEWSEGEYGRLFDIEHYLDGTLQLSPDRRIACIDFLKSLRPQPHWKPTEEQMTVLEIACKYERVFTQWQLSILLDLKEQLKKL